MSPAGPQPPLRILGIDPGLADLGYGIIEQSADGRREAIHLVHGVIQTKAGVPMAMRLDTIFRELSAIVEEFRPDAAAIEEIFFSKNVKTAVVVAQARGVAILATARAGIPVAEYSPPQIKQALAGYGKAGKMQVQMMVKAVLGLDEVPHPDHAADALATALCHFHILGSVAGRVASLGLAEEPILETSANKLLLAQAKRGRRRR